MPLKGEEKREYMRTYNAKNRDKIREKQRKYYKDHREHLSKKSLEYSKNNPEKKKKYRDSKKEHISNKNKKWRADNPEYMKDYMSDYNSKYYEDNKEEIKVNTSKWAKNNRDKINEKKSKKRKSDKKYKVECLLRSRLAKAIKRKSKKGSAVDLLGCSIEFFIDHIASMFQVGMSWDNHGEWHIDHIIPLAAFDLENLEQLSVACHHTNLQPLWAKDNMSKGDKII